jgi:hypothetical protein
VAAKRSSRRLVTVITNSVHSDAVAQGDRGKSPAPLNSNQLPSAFAALLDIPPSAPGIAANPGTLSPSGGLPSNAPEKKRPQNPVPDLAAAVPPVIPQVPVNLQRLIALPSSSAAVNTESDSAAAAKTHAVASVNPSAFSPPADALPTAGVARNDHGDVTSAPWRPTISGAPLSNLGPAQPSSGSAKTSVDAPQVGLAMPSMPPVTLDSVTSPAAPTTVSPSRQPPSVGLAGNVGEPGEMNGSTLPAVSNANLQCEVVVPPPQLNRSDSPPPALVIAPESSVAVKETPTSSPEATPAISSSTNGSAVKKAPRNSGEKTLAVAPARTSSLTEFGSTRSENLAASTPAAAELPSSSLTRPKAETPAIPPGVGESDSEKSPQVFAERDHATPQSANSWVEAMATLNPGSVATVVAVVPDLAKPQIPAESPSTPTATPPTIVSALPAQPAGSPLIARTPAAVDPGVRTSSPPEPSGTAVVQTARLMESVGQSEMHIGMRTQAFGSVEVHTAFREAQLGLAVSSEKGDLRSFLQSDGPALQNALQQHDLRFENIRFLQTSTGTTPGFSGSPDSQRHASTLGGGSLSPSSLASVSDGESTEISEPTTRLSVHA